MLPMTRPTKHPKTGTYLLRVAIPAHLRETTTRLYGVRQELRENLGTKDAEAARQRAPEALARLREKLNRAERVVSAEPVQPSLRDIAALAGTWYRQRTGAAHTNTELADAQFEINAALGGEAWNDDGIAALVPQMARRLLQDNGFATTPDSLRLMSATLTRTVTDYREFVERRTTGDWSADTNLAKFPHLSPETPHAVPAPSVGPGCTFDVLLRGWALDRGYQFDVKPIARALYDRQRTIERLASFLGHRDADCVSKADVVRWKEEALGRGLTVSTVRNDISEMSAVWAWGLRNGKLRGADNPFQGTLPPKAKKRARDPRAFTDAEAVTILQAARRQTGFMRWLPWVLCLTGARLNEIGQADTADVTTHDGVHVIRIHDEGDGRSVKNADSKRMVPLHPALIAEGFLAYVASLPAGSPLWPDVRPDAVFGQRSVAAGKKIGRWLRSDLGMTDALISPNHSWRHWFIGACRRVVMPVEVRSAITGHSARMDESAGYGDGMGTFTQVVAGYMAKVVCPVGEP